MGFARLRGPSAPDSTAFRRDRPRFDRPASAGTRAFPNYVDTVSGGAFVWIWAGPAARGDARSRAPAPGRPCRCAGADDTAPGADSRGFRWNRTAFEVT